MTQAKPVMVNCPACKRLNFTYPQPDTSRFLSSLPCKWCGEQINRPTDSESGTERKTPKLPPKLTIIP